MQELLTSLMHMLDEAQHLHSAGSGFGTSDLQQLVLIVADGRFHEKDGLKRLVTVCPCVFVLLNHRCYN